MERRAHERRATSSQIHATQTQLGCLPTELLTKRASFLPLFPPHPKVCFQFQQPLRHSTLSPASSLGPCSIGQKTNTIERLGVSVTLFLDTKRLNGWLINASLSWRLAGTFFELVEKVQPNVAEHSIGTTHWEAPTTVAHHHLQLLSHTSTSQTEYQVGNFFSLSSCHSPTKHSSLFSSPTNDRNLSAISKK